MQRKFSHRQRSSKARTFSVERSANSELKKINTKSSVSKLLKCCTIRHIAVSVDTIHVHNYILHKRPLQLTFCIEGTGETQHGLKLSQVGLPESGCPPPHKRMPSPSFCGYYYSLLLVLLDPTLKSIKFAEAQRYARNKIKLRGNKARTQSTSRAKLNRDQFT